MFTPGGKSCVLKSEINSGENVSFLCVICYLLPIFYAPGGT